jgi:probable rRNA maturation factor
MAEINLFKEGVKFRLSKSKEVKAWLIRVAKREGKSIGSLNYIFCTDTYLRKMNVQYLQHDYNTDVITFDNSEAKKIINGDVFISIDRVHANAKDYSTTFNDELHRVMVHGLLHLLGYDDKSASKKKEMREKEELHLRSIG